MSREFIVFTGFSVFPLLFIPRTMLLMSDENLELHTHIIFLLQQECGTHTHPHMMCHTFSPFVLTK
jgi:hypothetical protein